MLRAGGRRTVQVAIVLICAAGAVFIAVGVADSTDSPDSPLESGQPHGGGDTAWIPTHDRVVAHEALPCTGPYDPTNFEIFSAGPTVAGLPVSATVRRCDVAAPAHETPANRITYMYGRCETLPEDEVGCVPPLEVQTWPACQRSLADYSFEGRPLPFRQLPKHGGAEVVEFDFALERRIEVYTKSSTIVIFADSPELGRKAVEHLSPQQVGKQPVTNAADLRGSSPGRLAPPTDGAMEGDLECRS